MGRKRKVMPSNLKRIVKWDFNSKNRIKIIEQKVVEVGVGNCVLAISK